MDEISIEVKRELIDQRIKQWKNNLFLAKVDVETAQSLIEANVEERGKALLDQAQTEIKQAKVAIDTLEKKLAELQ